MTNRDPRELLQSIIITALENGDTFANVQAMSAFDKQDMADPGLFPLAVVQMPEQVTSTPICENLNRAEYEFDVLILASEFSAVEAAKDLSQYTDTVRRMLAGITRATLRPLGIQQNAFAGTDEEWVGRGQDVAYRMQFRVIAYQASADVITV